MKRAADPLFVFVADLPQSVFLDIGKIEVKAGSWLMVEQRKGEKMDYGGGMAGVHQRSLRHRESNEFLRRYVNAPHKNS